MFSFATKSSPERERLVRAAQAGFDSAELWLCEAHLQDVDPLIEAARRVSLKWVLHFPNHGDLDEAHLANAVRLYRALDAWALVIHKPMLRRYGRRLFARAGDVTLAVENGRQNPDQFRAWAREHDALTLDVEHLWKFTLRDAAMDQLMDELGWFWSEHGGKVRHVHLPGYVPGAPEHRPAYCNPILMDRVWSFLLEQDYRGLVVSELDVNFQTSQHLRRDVLLYRRWLRGGTGRGYGMRRSETEDWLPA